MHYYYYYYHYLIYYYYTSQHSFILMLCPTYMVPSAESMKLGEHVLKRHVFPSDGFSAIKLDNTNPPKSTLHTKPIESLLSVHSSLK